MGAPTALSTVCVCVCSSPLAGSIFVYWTTFCQLLIAHQLPPTVQQCRFCRLSRLQGCKDRQRARACGDKKGVKVQKAGLEQEGQTSESRHLVGELTSYETETGGGVTRNLSVATHQTHILYTAAPHHPAQFVRQSCQGRSWTVFRKCCLACGDDKYFVVAYRRLQVYEVLL